MEYITAIRALAALGQETRWDIYTMLVPRGPAGLPAGRIGKALTLAPATLSFHLRELSHAGLVRARQDGRFLYYRAEPTAMSNLLEYLATNCRPETRTGATQHRSDGASVPFPFSPGEIPSPAVKPVIHPKRRVA